MYQSHVCRAQWSRCIYVHVAAIFLIIFGSQVRAAWQSVGDVKSVTKQENGVTLALSSGAVANIYFVNTDIVRVRIAPNGKFEKDF